MTVVLTCFSAIGATVIGTVVAILRVSPVAIERTPPESIENPLTGERDLHYDRVECPASPLWARSPSTP